MALFFFTRLDEQRRSVTKRCFSVERHHFVTDTSISIDSMSTQKAPLCYGKSVSIKHISYFQKNKSAILLRTILCPSSLCQKTPPYGNSFLDIGSMETEMSVTEWCVFFFLDIGLLDAELSVTKWRFSFSQGSMNSEGP